MRERIIRSARSHGLVCFFTDRTGLGRFHSHPEVEFNLVTAGSAYYIVNATRTLVTPGTLIWFSPAHEHILVDVSDSFSMWIGVLAVEAGREIGSARGYESFGSLDGDRVQARRLPAACVRELSGLCSALSRTSVESDPTRFNRGIDYLFMEAWSAYRDGRAVAIGDEVSPLVAAVLRAVSDAGGCLQLRELERRLNASGSWISRAFRRETGIGFVEYCNRVKLARFEQLATAHPHRTLTSLALDTGFGSYAQFYRVYRAAYGSGPAGSGRT
jgi:AraC-like DNA-binding protein